MKNILLLIITLLPLTALSGESNPLLCFTEDSNTITTEDFHCKRKCGNWANAQPYHSISLALSKEFRSKGAFYKNPKITCSGEGCPWSTQTTPSVIKGTTVSARYKNWGRPTVITLKADVCILNIGNWEETTFGFALASVINPSIVSSLRGRSVKRHF